MKSNRKFVNFIFFLCILSILVFAHRKFQTPQEYPDFGAESSKNIFFVSTGKGELNARQACAVESASKHNQDSIITVYTSNELGFLHNDTYANILKQLKNTRFQKIDVENASKSTPLEEWVSGEYWRYSYHLTEQTSDIIRYCLLWKQGGIYLDLDTITLRSMSNLTNCAAMDSPDKVTNAVLVFSPRHEIISSCIKMIPKAWSGEVFTELGPDLITKVFKLICGVDDLNSTSREQCHGAKLLPPKSFYLVPWKDWAYLFVRYWTEGLLQEILEHKSYLVHFYNKISKRMVVKFGAYSLIEVLAKNNCPRVYAESKRQKKF